MIYKNKRSMDLGNLVDDSSIYLILSVCILSELSDSTKWSFLPQPIFNGVIVDQPSEHFEYHFCNYLSGFGKGHDCQGVLIWFRESLSNMQFLHSALSSNELKTLLLTPAHLYTPTP